MVNIILGVNLLQIEMRFFQMSGTVKRRPQRLLIFDLHLQEAGCFLGLDIFADHRRLQILS